MSKSRRFALGAVVLLAVTGALVWHYYHPASVSVIAVAETVPVPSSEDAADDAAIWVDPVDPEKSLVIGTDKRSGLYVYDLSGAEVQRFENGKQNNVDLRRNVSHGSGVETLVVSTQHHSEKIFVYRIDEAQRRLERLVTSTFKTTFDVEGICMYTSPKSKKTYVFVNGNDNTAHEYGICEQWELAYDAAQDRYVATLARRLVLGSEVEGCVADDANGLFYLSQETVSVWRYGAEPDDATPRVSIDTIGPSGNLRYNAEGIALYARPDGSGYLIVSSQGSDDYCVYDRKVPNTYVGRFKIVAGNGIDGTSHTDGIDAVSTPLGAKFPDGLFVAQDDKNDGGANQNFKLVSFRAILDALKS